MPDGRSTAYVAQHDLFGQIPALGDAVETPKLVEAGALSTVSAWLGTGGTVTRAHFDSMDNIFLQLSGTPARLLPLLRFLRLLRLWRLLRLLLAPIKPHHIM